MKSTQKTPLNDSTTALRLLIANSTNRDSSISQCIMTIKRDLDELVKLRSEIATYKGQLSVLLEQISSLKNEIFALQTMEAIQESEPIEIRKPRKSTKGITDGQS